MIALVSKLVKTITLRSVMLLTLAGVLGILSLIVFENRGEIFNSIRPEQHYTQNVVGHEFIVSDDTKDRVSKLLASDSTYVGVAILSSDLRLNSRHAIYVAEPAASPKRLAQLSTVARLPFFTKNEVNNRQMVKLVNGEFSCWPYTTSLEAQIVVNDAERNVTICRASLPPYYGFFSGFISLRLNADPTVEQQARIKGQLEELATEIYFHDVIPTNRKVTF